MYVFIEKNCFNCPTEILKYWPTDNGTFIGLFPPEGRNTDKNQVNY